MIDPSNAELLTVWEPTPVDGESTTVDPFAYYLSVNDSGAYRDMDVYIRTANYALPDVQVYGFSYFVHAQNNQIMLAEPFLWSRNGAVAGVRGPRITHEITPFRFLTKMAIVYRSSWRMVDESIFSGEGLPG